MLLPPRCCTLRAGAAVAMRRTSFRRRFSAFMPTYRYCPRWRLATWFYHCPPRRHQPPRRQRPRDGSARSGRVCPAGPLETAVVAEDRRSLWSARRVPEEQVTALWLYYVEDLPTREIARFSVAPGSSEDHVASARKKPCRWPAWIPPAERCRPVACLLAGGIDCPDNSTAITKEVARPPASADIMFKSPSSRQEDLWLTGSAARHWPLGPSFRACIVPLPGRGAAGEGFGRVRPSRRGSAGLSSRRGRSRWLPHGHLGRRRAGTHRWRKSPRQRPAAASTSKIATWRRLANPRRRTCNRRAFEQTAEWPQLARLDYWTSRASRS